MFALAFGCYVTHNCLTHAELLIQHFFHLIFNIHDAVHHTAYIRISYDTKTYGTNIEHKNVWFDMNNLLLCAFFICNLVGCHVLLCILSTCFGWNFDFVWYFQFKFDWHIVLLFSYLFWLVVDFFYARFFKKKFY